jgi:hypothetical protein
MRISSSLPARRPTELLRFRAANEDGYYPRAGRRFLTILWRRGSELVLTEAGLRSSASSRDPSGGSISAIVGARVEGDWRARGSLTNSVDDDFE